MATSWQPEGLQDVVRLLDDPARAAVAEAATAHVRPGMILGLGSGRAVWATTELLSRRDDLSGATVVTASSVTAALAGDHGFAVVQLDGETRPDLYVDGADEVAPDLGLLKGHGAALLREKLIAIAARRFVVVAEAAKRVERLGDQRPLPVEVVRFAWPDTRRRLLEHFADVTVRLDGEAPLVTEEGHHLFDVEMPGDGPATEVATRLDATVGVVDHGLFLDLADVVLLGGSDGSVEVRRRGAHAGRER